jgi:hypothetical protein
MTVRTVSGPLYDPLNSTVIAEAKVRFRALRNNYSSGHAVVKGAMQYTTTSVAGNFTVNVALGDYRVEIQRKNETNWVHIGDCAVESGSTVNLGYLIELTRDKTADYSISADWVTWDQMTAYVGGGGSPGDIDITDLGVGTAQAYCGIEIDVNGSAVIGRRHLGLALCFGGF